MLPVALPYADRHAAGRTLAAALAHLVGRSGLLVLALPRGGVAVGYEVARALDAPLEGWVVRKLGFPGTPEYAMGALALRRGPSDAPGAAAAPAAPSPPVRSP